MTQRANNAMIAAPEKVVCVMMLVPKSASDMAEPVPIDPAYAAAVTRWYAGSDDNEDEQLALELVRLARVKEYWFACDCRADEDVPAPLLTAVLLAMADTYYLRRLEGTGRSAHAASCTFFRDQVLRAKATSEAANAVSKRPSGYFSIVQPAPDHLAQKPDDGTAPTDTKKAIPKLARLLWWLMDEAGLNIINSAKEASQASIKDGFGALRKAAREHLVAPGRPLHDWLFLHPGRFHDGSIRQALEGATPHWPKRHAPQAFMAVYCPRIDRNRIQFNDVAPIEVMGPIQQPTVGDRAIRGPYLVMIAVGEHPEGKGFGALRAYAQPVFSGRLMVPVESGLERDAFAELISLQERLAARRITLALKKPLFDLMSEDGPCRPDVMLRALDHDTDRIADLIVETIGFESEEQEQRKAKALPLMARFAPIATISAEDVQSQNVAMSVEKTLLAELAVQHNAVT